MNFASKTKQSGNKYVARVVHWLADAIGDLKHADESISTMAMEVQCGEPGCVPIETMIALLSAILLPSGKCWRWTGKILKPIAEVTEEDVRCLPLPTTICEESAAGVDKVSELRMSPLDLDDLTLSSAMKSHSETESLSSSSTMETSAVVAQSLNSGGSVKLASKPSFTPAFVDESDRRATLKEKHKAGVRARGCPCCDPDNLDNVLDSLLFNPI
jgi:hypothetical protein